MELKRYTHIGNKIFAKRLKLYSILGNVYHKLWEDAFDDFIRAQKGKTDQGIQHCRDVENNLGILINKNIKNFPNEVLYILSASAALHDIGKVEEGENHAEVGAELVKGLIDNYFYKKSTAIAIAHIIKTHDNGDFGSVPVNMKIEHINIPLRNIAALFRLADIMSTSEERAFKYLKKINIGKGAYKNFVNNVRSSIDCVEINSEDRTQLNVYAYSKEAGDNADLKQYVNGLNQDINKNHQKLLQNFVIYNVSNTTLKETVKEISFPYEFNLTWHSNVDQLKSKKIQFSSDEIANSVTSESPSYIPCYYMPNDTDIDIHAILLKSIDEGIIDNKYLYWSLTGTKNYLSLSKNPNYDLPDIAHSFLKKSFKTEFIPKLRNIEHIIDLGVGNGEELNIIINQLLETTKAIKRCTIIDCSFHMIRYSTYKIFVFNNENEQFKKIKFDSINCDFRNLLSFKKFLPKNLNKLFIFIGGTLGNYFETDILNPIVKLIDSSDYLLLGVDLIGDKTEEDLLLSYQNVFNKKFLFSPLQEVNYNFKSWDLNCTVEINSKHHSNVNNSATVISSFLNYNLKKQIQVAISTKYNIQDLSDYLISFGFEVLYTSMDKDYALVLLKVSSK